MYLHSIWAHKPLCVCVNVFDCSLIWLLGKWEETLLCKVLAGNVGMKAWAKASPLGVVVCGTLPLWCMCMSSIETPRPGKMSSSSRPHWEWQKIISLKCSYSC